MKEISLHLLDIAENSIKANASRVVIGLELNRESDWLKIEIVDNGCGMNSRQVAQIIDPFFTTRTTRKVGLGLPLLKHHAEATGGHIAIESEPGRGTRVTALFGFSHIDRQPIGDVGGVLANLSASYPSIDFVLEASCGADNYRFSSCEVSLLLSPVPLSEPDVNQGIREMINSNLETILNQ